MNSGQQTGSVGVYKETAEISAVSNRSISDQPKTWTLKIDEFGKLRDIHSCCNESSSYKHEAFWFNEKQQTLRIYVPHKFILKQRREIEMVWYDIRYCPFCGSKIVVETVRSKDYTEGDVIQ